MNERLVELMKQATVREAHYPAGNDGHPEYTSYVSQEKFAELVIAEFSDIVKETAILVAQTAYNDGEDAVSVQKRVDGALRVLEVLRKRLGVE
jgi:hypothetical protein